MTDIYYIIFLNVCLYRSFNLVKNRQMITDMYETVLNHTYKGKLKKETSEVKDLNDYGKWEKAKKTHLVCKIDGDDPIIIANTSGKAKGNHAEEKLIQELMKKSKVKGPTNSSGPESVITDMLKEMSIEKPKTESKTEETKTLNITIYMNNSPCSNTVNNCAGELIKMLDSNVRVSLIVYVTNLYNICRESCKDEYHNGFINHKNHKDNYTGLKTLMQHERCTIKAFTKDVWKELFKMTTKSDEHLDDYDKIMDGNERSREDEDKLIQKDLDHIRDNPL